MKERELLRDPRIRNSHENSAVLWSEMSPLTPWRLNCVYYKINTACKLVSNGCMKEYM